VHTFFQVDKTKHRPQQKATIVYAIQSSVYLDTIVSSYLL